MIYLLIIGILFLVTYGLFFLYWPSRRLLTLRIGHTTIHTFPPEFGFLFFMLAICFFIIGLLYYRVKNQNQEISLFTSLCLIATWLMFLFSQILKEVVIFLRPDLTGPNKNPVIGFTNPTYGFTLNILNNKYTVAPFEYYHILLLVGILGVILFFRHFNDMLNDTKNILKILNNYFEIEYKVATLFSTIIYSFFFVILMIASFINLKLYFIVILLGSTIFTLILFSIILLPLIKSGFSGIDKTKLNIRKNTFAFSFFLVLMYSIILDLLYLFFFSINVRDESFYWRFRDVMVNSLYTGMIYLEIALGITIVYKILKFANFAHAELVTFGGYVAFVIAAMGESVGTWYTFSYLGYFQWVPMFLIVCIMAFIVTAILAYIFDLILYKPLRNNDASPITLMIASFALGLAFRAVLQQVFTSNPLYISLYLINIHLDGIILRLFVITIVLFSTLFFQVLLYQTNYGKIMRALSDNEDLAKVVGVKTARIHLLIWIIAGGFAGIAGVLYTTSSSGVGSSSLFPFVGFNLLLGAFAVAILGGIGSFEGVVIASLIVGFTENMGVIMLSQLSTVEIQQKIKFYIPVIPGPSISTITIIFVIIFLIVLGLKYLDLQDQSFFPRKILINLLLIIVTILLIGSIIINPPKTTVTSITAQLSFNPAYRVALSYLILILVLKIRPYGLLGEKPSGDR